jgi:hypothetical protein
MRQASICCRLLLLFTYLFWSGLSSAGPALVTSQPAPAVPAANASSAAVVAQAPNRGTDKAPFRAVVSLSQRPTSRIWCHFSKGGEERIVSFDPVSDEMRLSVTLILEGSGWATRCYADPAPQTLQVEKAASYVDLAWQCQEPTGETGTFNPFVYGKNVAAGTLKIECKRELLRPTAAGMSLDNAPSATITVTYQPLLPINQAALEIRSSPFGQREKRAADAGGSALLRDTFELLAEIALERAKAKGARVIQQKLQAAVCEDLRYTITANRIDFQKQGDLLLPSLCEVIRDVPLAELVESSSKVARALEDDLTQLGFEIVIASSQRLVKSPALQQIVGNVLKRLEPALLSIVREREFSRLDAQLLMVALARDHSANAPTEAYDCSLQLAFGIAATCHNRSGGCEASDIIGMLASPASYFSNTDACVGIAKEWPAAPAFISRAQEVLRPAMDGTPRDLQRATLIIAFDMLELGVSMAQDDKSDKVRAQRMVERAKALTLAVLDRETRVVVTSGLAMVREAVACSLDRPCTESQEQLLAFVQKVTPVVVALTANASNLSKAAATPEEREALRESRKATLEAVIDAATERGTRGGDWVLSLGSNVGFRYGYATAGGDGDNGDMGNLSLPMGVALQFLPSRWVGAHFQMSFIDLGQFLDTANDSNQSDPMRTNDETAEAAPIEWNDFAMLGLQLGALLGNAENVFSLSVDGRYIPGGRLRGTWFIGGAISYYVPFFDLN